MYCKFCGAFFSQNLPEVYGDLNSSILLVGEAPGANEMKTGEPFIGRAGMVLMDILESVGVKKSQFRVINSVCYHPKNAEGETRAPTDAEIITCQPHIKAEIARHPVSAIITFGNTALRTMTNVNKPIGEVRGTKCISKPEFGGLPVYPTWHPSYILRGHYAEKDVVASDIKRCLLDTNFISTELPQELICKAVEVEEFEQYVSSCKQSGEWLAFDTETTGVHITDKIIGASFSYQDSVGIYVPLLKRNILGELSPYNIKTYKRTLELLKDLLTSQANPKIAFNAKFDEQMIFRNWKYWPERVMFDPMIAYWLQNEEEKKPNLNFLTQLFFPQALTLKSKVKSLGLKDYSYLDIETLSIYASEDAIYTRLLGLKLMNILTNIKGYPVLNHG